jgi:hypothetical protein
VVTTLPDSAGWEGCRARLGGTGLEFFLATAKEVAEAGEGCGGTSGGGVSNSFQSNSGGVSNEENEHHNNDHHNINVGVHNEQSVQEAEDAGEGHLFCNNPKWQMAVWSWAHVVAMGRVLLFGKKKIETFKLRATMRTYYY